MPSESLLQMCPDIVVHIGRNQEKHTDFELHQPVPLVMDRLQERRHYKRPRFNAFTPYWQEVRATGASYNKIKQNISYDKSSRGHIDSVASFF